ncbi:hypothetical protein Aperf_G00000069064 [Anoplocephala perfoliata]
MVGNGFKSANGSDKNRTCLGLRSDYGGKEVDYWPLNKLFGKQIRLCNDACRMASCIQCREVLIREELEHIFEDTNFSNLEYLYVNMDHNRYVPMSAILNSPSMVELEASTLDLLRVGEQCRMLEMDPTFTKFRVIQRSKYSNEVHYPPRWDLILGDQLLTELPRTQSLNVNFIIDIERLNSALNPSIGVPERRALARIPYQGDRA